MASEMGGLYNLICIKSLVLYDNEIRYKNEVDKRQTLWRGPCGGGPHEVTVTK